MSKSFFCGVVPEREEYDTILVKLISQTSEYVPLSSYVRKSNQLRIPIRGGSYYTYEDMINSIVLRKELHSARVVSLKAGPCVLGDFLLLSYPKKIISGIAFTSLKGVNIDALISYPDILFCMVCKKSTDRSDIILSASEDGCLINADHIEFWVSPGFDHKDTPYGGLRKVYRKYLLSFFETIGIEPKEKENINSLFIEPLYPIPKTTEDYDKLSKNVSVEILRKEKRLLMYNLEL